MRDYESVNHLRWLVAEDRGIRADNPSRVGRVIRRYRPGIATANNALVDANGVAYDLDRNLLWLDSSARQQVAEIVRQYSAAVGRIDVRRQDGTWLPAGTCWVTSAGTDGANARIATAGHLLCYMLQPGNGFGRGRMRTEFDPAIMRETRISFADDPDDGDDCPRVKAIIWPHKYWDMLICELDRPLPNVKPPPLTRTTWKGAARRPLAVLGYPIAQGLIHGALSTSGFAQVFEGDLEIKRLSPGLFIETDAAPADVTSLGGARAVSLRHDASTLGGSSGSPVFCLRHGCVVGLHFRGGSYYNDDNLENQTPADHANLAVPFVMALEDPLLVAELCGDPLPAGAPPREPFSGLWKASNIDQLDETASIFVATSGRDVPVELLRAVVPDRPDTRDYYYTAPLAAPLNEVLAPTAPVLHILNQGSDPACVGFAMAALINLQRRLSDPKAMTVSPRMLYEMALSHDEWLDETLGGTSLRAAIKGFFYSGVCSEEVAPYIARQNNWRLNRRIADDAKAVMPGPYYRLRHNLVDFQAAIQEAGAIIVSAYIHDGWFRSDGNSIRHIPLRHHRPTERAAHCFVAVGYNEKGFIIQNSWGPEWGNWDNRPGLACWSYADWAQNVIDAWVLRLAPSTPDTFGLQPVLSQGEDTSMPEPLRRLPKPHRFALLGHIVHAERDEVVDRGRLGLGLASLREAGAQLRAADPGKMRHILLIYHDPFLGTDAIARIAAFQTVPFLRNGIFPLHIAYGVDEVATISARMLYEADLVLNRFGSSLSEASGYLERRAGRLCGRLVRDFSGGAAEASVAGGALWQARSALCLEAAKGRSVSVLTFGAGSIAALTQYRVMRAAGNPPLHHLLLVGATGARPTKAELGTARLREWQLPVAGEIGAVPAYSGDWNDLVQAVQGGDFGPRVNETAGSALPGSIAACCVDAKLLNDVIAAVKGRAPTPNNRFRAV